ncbi:large ribosomal subunit protein bL19m isoform X1 [Austrofundulus limnaeus]|uniref:Large ribosomal subunit protein bL19m n=1 Tax=Austrofundulus limnaeus TaxID=52670 RepID=A0A2I4BCH5_AUSLI|nr:PREDICTED: 39S ribosomal protein L19, mitochondrial isoform X1 [Austrofundulus limnaeus]
MAARVKGFDKLNLSLRLCRNVLLQNERFLSTSACLRGTSEPPKFVPPSKPVIIDKEQTVESRRKFLSPEFIPPRQRTLPFKFRLERADMVRRRKVLKIPEFYVGSILAVTMADLYASGKTNRFVGICIRRGGSGLGATFILRNIINNQGVEMNYDLYSPRIQSIEVLKLEKRLDDDLMYLRDALSEYSMVDPEMKPVPIPTTGDVPVNKLKVVMRPRPWSKHWDWSKFNIQGIRFDLCKSIKATAKAKKQERPWLEYDMLKEYDTSELEERIYEEVQQEMKK